MSTTDASLPLIEALRRLMPAIEKGIGGLVFTADRAGEVTADMNAIRAALAQQAPAVAGPVPLEWSKAVQEAYGWLWNINNEPLAPIPLLPEGKAAYQARKALRDLLTTEQRGEAINAVRGMLENLGALPAAQQAPAVTGHVGDSAFERWFAQYDPAGKGDKQLARDAYAAGMSDPAAQQAPAVAVATTAEASGPRIQSRTTCKGCPSLKTEHWTDYLENDETDSGTAATCLMNGKSISAYWHEGDATPDWCPAAAQQAPAAEPVAPLSDAFQDECARTDSLLTILGLDPWRCRTEGGSLMPRKVLEQMAEKRAAVADDHLRAALHWIAGATTQTPGLTDAQLGKLLSGIKACAEQALAAAPQPPQAQPLTDALLLQAVRSSVRGTTIRLTRDVGPYEVTEPTHELRSLAAAILTAAGIKGAA